MGTLIQLLAAVKPLQRGRREGDEGRLVVRREIVEKRPRRAEQRRQGSGCHVQLIDREDHLAARTGALLVEKNRSGARTA